MPPTPFMLEGMQVRRSLDSLASPRRPRLEIDTSAGLLWEMIACCFGANSALGDSDGTKPRLITSRMPAANAAIVPTMKPTEPRFFGCSQACCSRIWSMMDGGIPAPSL